MTTIGLIANPVSARDIRRIIANASNLRIADRVNIVLRVLRVLTAAHSLGVERVLVMPDNGGIRALLMRHLARGHSQHQQWPVVEFLDLEPTSTVDDTLEAARLLRATGVAAIVVLGGDKPDRLQRVGSASRRPSEAAAGRLQLPQAEPGTCLTPGRAQARQPR